MDVEGGLLRISGDAEVEVQRNPVVGILKDAEGGVRVADLLRNYGVSQGMFFKVS